MARKKVVQPMLPIEDEISCPEDGCPPFLEFLNTPLVDMPLPSNFRPAEEAKFLKHLWEAVPKLRDFTYQRFVHAGSSGMVFQVQPSGSNTSLALKVARNAALRAGQDGTSDNNLTLSLLSERELEALAQVSHSNIVRLHTSVMGPSGVVAVATTYVDNPKPLDDYMRKILERQPPTKGRKGVHRFSAQRAKDACKFLVDRFQEMASAIAHMHSIGMYHCDIKPANILISDNNTAMLTDLGSCTLAKDVRNGKSFRVRFTWTYAHPRLTSMASEPGSISGQGLKASAQVGAVDDLETFDLFSFGRTIQEVLGVLVSEFGERCYATYGFRFLHLISCLLLDGQNAPAAHPTETSSRDGRRFVSDQALNYPCELFARHKIKTALELKKRLARFGRQHSWFAIVPELDPWQAETVNTGVGSPAPFTRRVASVLGHPALRRLKNEHQLGWIREVYPGATHNRWSHTIGVYAAVISYYNSLLADPDIPTLQVLLEPSDVNHALLAALLHDLGQTEFGHDFESACPHLYKHEDMVERILKDKFWGSRSLKEAISEAWPEENIERVLRILKFRSEVDRQSAPEKATLLDPKDGVAADILNGPIDADKYDYVLRDSVGCGVPYGLGVDRQRFLHALSVDARQIARGSRFALAYKAKGRPAIESLLLARYQMYGAVYWHHTFRCAQAMFAHAASSTFEGLNLSGRKKMRDAKVVGHTVADLLYHWVVCGKPLGQAISYLKDETLPQDFKMESPADILGDRALEFVWKFSDDRMRNLIQRLGRRELYKRVFELRISELGSLSDYSRMQTELKAEARAKIAGQLEEVLLKTINKQMIERGPVESLSEFDAKSMYETLRLKSAPWLVVDFPTRGVPEERNFPAEIGDPARKYMSTAHHTPGGNGSVFHTVRVLQSGAASLRVFAAPELHDLIARYLNYEDIRACVEEVIPLVSLQD